MLRVIELRVVDERSASPTSSSRRAQLFTELRLGSKSLTYLIAAFDYDPGSHTNHWGSEHDDATAVRLGEHVGRDSTVDGRTGDRSRGVCDGAGRRGGGHGRPHAAGGHAGVRGGTRRRP